MSLLLARCSMVTVKIKLKCSQFLNSHSNRILKWLTSLYQPSGKFSGHHLHHFLMGHQVADSSYDGSAIGSIPVHQGLLMDQAVCP